VINPAPPPRAAFYGDTETLGFSAYDCACNLIDTLAGFAHTGRAFKGDAHGRVWVAQMTRNEAQLAFTSDHGEGFIQLSVVENHWVRADVFLGGAHVLRAWVEEPYEEKEFWPDGAVGIVAPNGDPPGRISKRGRWLQLRAADFPGVPDRGGGFLSFEDAFD